MGGSRPVEPFPDDAVAHGVIERFAVVAERHADRVALRSPAGEWTYADLWTAVTERAGGLVEVVGRDRAPVAILATHDGPLVVTLLATLAAGHIAVILDPLAPRPQLEHILRECDTRLLVHDDAHAEMATELSRAVGGRARPRLLGDLRGPAPELPRGVPDDPILLAFTSGTSGQPKGGIITNGVLMNLVRGATDRLSITAEDRMPMLFPTSLAVAAYPLFLPLLNGGTLATLDVRSVGLAPVADFLQDERITLAYLAPTVVRFLVDALAGRSFPDLRMVAMGGEVVDGEVVNLAADLFGVPTLANGYGTTETGVIALEVIDATDPPDGPVPSGLPVPDTELLVLDDRGEVLPQGEPGEIAVVSPYLFLGYWGHPELSRQVLAEDPAGRPRWRMYRTGDHGHLDAAGRLVVAGRLDTKVKIRGRFVVLGEVEADLHADESVADAAVVARTHSGIAELVGYVVPASGEGGLDTAALRARLLDRNEAYRVPTRWIVLDELPRLPNGKTDRRSLPTAEVVQGTPATTGGRADAGEATGTHREHERLREAVRAIWQRLLPSGPIGLDEDFFHLGGDSLLAAQMLVVVEQELGVTVPMGELVHARTARQLGEVIARLHHQRSAAVSTVSCVQLGDERRPRLWFVHDLQGSAYRVRHLAAALGDDQPVWSFESPLLRGEPNRFRRLETFVANYLRDLRTAQPEGPYWVAGYSFGGICAYEMARQLRADGQEVAFVGVVDVGPGYRGPGWHANRSPFRPWFGVAKPPPPGTRWRAQVQHYVEMFTRSPSGAARHVMVRTGAARVVDPWRFRSDLRRDGRVRPEWRLWYAWEEHWKLAAQLWPRTGRYEGRMDLFWANDSPAADATMGWGPLVDDLHIHRFAGDHEGILEPWGAPALATSLRRALDARLGAP